MPSPLAVRLLEALKVSARTDTEDLPAIDAWAASGAMYLTGPADGPPRPEPAELARRMDALAGALAHLTGSAGAAVSVDGPALMGERAATARLGRHGSTSVGGGARMVRVADGWIALNLARPSDVEALPALVAAPVDPGDWDAVRRRLAESTADGVIDIATDLGVPVARASVDRGPAPALPWRALAEGGLRRPGRPLVVDLSGLWAGPLAGSLIARTGADVVKVEGRRRPDGARLGPAPFFDLLNAGKKLLALDPGDPADLSDLRRLMERADLVIESSRPRVAAQWGIDPRTLVDAGTSWVSITGHGRTGVESNRVAFGDDAAVAAGVVIDGSPPEFVADAVADPVAGLVAAVVGVAALNGDRAVLADVSLRHAAGWARGDAPDSNAPVSERGGRWFVDAGDRLLEVEPPRARRAAGSAGRLGADNRELQELLGARSHSGHDTDRR